MLDRLSTVAIAVGLTVAACAATGATDDDRYVERLNSLSLLAGDASDCLFPEKPPRSRQEFAGENLSSAASALRDLSRMTEIEPPARFRSCHAGIRAHANGLEQTARHLQGAAQTATPRAAAMVGAWAQVRARTTRRLCGLSAAVSSCARDAEAGQLGPVIPFIPARVRCP